MSWLDHVSTVGRFVGRFLGGPGSHSEVVGHAAMSFASAVLELLRADGVTDIREHRSILRNAEMRQRRKFVRRLLMLRIRLRDHAVRGTSPNWISAQRRSKLQNRKPMSK